MVGIWSVFFVVSEEVLASLKSGLSIPDGIEDLGRSEAERDGELE